MHRTAGNKLLLARKELSNIFFMEIFIFEKIHDICVHKP